MRTDAALTDRRSCELLAELRRHPWGVYAKQPLDGPAQVLDYLARYTQQVAISDERLLHLGHGEVGLSGSRLSPRQAQSPSKNATPQALSGAFCYTSCRKGSSVSAITACSPIATKQRNSLPAAPRFGCPNPTHR